MSKLTDGDDSNRIAPPARVIARYGDAVMADLRQFAALIFQAKQALQVVNIALPPNGPLQVPYFVDCQFRYEPCRSRGLLALAEFAEFRLGVELCVCHAHLESVTCTPIGGQNLKKGPM